MAAGQPLMHIDLFGASLDLYPPTKGQVEKFIAANDTLIAALEKIAQNPDAENADSVVTVRDMYDMAAEFISMNTDSVKVTGDELLTKYGVNGEMLLAFYCEYSNFISTVRNQKN